MKNTFVQQWNGERYVRMQVWLDDEFDLSKPIAFYVEDNYNWEDFRDAYKANDFLPDPLQAQRLITFEYQTRKIEAIKLVRKLTGWGLKESKDFVEANC